MISVKYLEKNLPAYVSESSYTENCMRDSQSNLYIIPYNIDGNDPSEMSSDLIRFKAKFLNSHSNRTWCRFENDRYLGTIIPSRYAEHKDIYIIDTYKYRDNIALKFLFDRDDNIKVNLKDFKYFNLSDKEITLELKIDGADLYGLFKNKSCEYSDLNIKRCKLMSDINTEVGTHFTLEAVDSNGHSVVIDTNETEGYINFIDIDLLATDLIEINSSNNSVKLYFFIKNTLKLTDLDFTTSKQFYWDKQLYIARRHVLENVKVRFDKYIVTSQEEIQAKNSLVIIDNLEINETPLSKSKLDGALIKIKNLIINNGEENFDMFTGSFKIEIENIISTKPFVNLCPNGVSNSIIYKGETYNRKGKVIL